MEANSTISKFNVVLSDYQIAYQIALLLNKNNMLNKEYDVNSIIKNQVKYFIEIKDNNVIGCIGLLEESKLDKILHISVDETERKRGVGYRLLNSVLYSSTKNELYMHVRENNIPSLRLSKKLGFRIIAYIPKHNYNLFTLCLSRRKYNGGESRFSRGILCSSRNN